MEYSFNEFIYDRPQRLCNKCGKCCRTVATRNTYAELIELSEKGDKDAKDFLDLFLPYSSLEAAKKATPDIVENIINKLDEEEVKKITFYKCKHLSSNNLCKIYQKRPDLCRNFPATPWTVLPPGCGFEGWQFQKREEEKQIVRKYKEDLLALNATINDADIHTAGMMRKKMEKIKKIIDKYEEYGSADW